MDEQAFTRFKVKMNPRVTSYITLSPLGWQHLVKLNIVIPQYVWYLSAVHDGDDTHWITKALLMEAYVTVTLVTLLWWIFRNETVSLSVLSVCYWITHMLCYYTNLRWGGVGVGDILVSHCQSLCPSACAQNLVRSAFSRIAFALYLP